MFNNVSLTTCLIMGEGCFQMSTSIHDPCLAFIKMKQSLFCFHSSTLVMRYFKKEIYIRLRTLTFNIFDSLYFITNSLVSWISWAHQGQSRPPGSKNAYRRTYISSINKVFTSAGYL